MAALAARLCNLNDNKIRIGLKKIKNVDGRLELIRKFPNNIKVFVDGAQAVSHKKIDVKCYLHPW